MKKLFCTSLIIAFAVSVMAQDYYSNPVIDKDFPDPTVVEVDGKYYAYATGRQVPVFVSDNMVDWESAGNAFTREGRPNFEPRAGVWAPDISLIEGKYVLYYSMSVWDGIHTCGIGRAVADNPLGPFEDKGKLFRSNEIGVTNSIDPFYIEDDGKKYLFWGSFYGIYGIQLTDDGLDLYPGAKPEKIGGSAFEATYIHKRDGYYYFFASVGSCCAGVNSTYQLVVGRSKSLFGPYVDKEGKPMLDNGYTVVIGNSNRFVGNGHCSEIVQDAGGQDWIFYHGVDVTDPRGRKMLADQIRWDEEGWPYVEGNVPSKKALRPNVSND